MHRLINDMKSFTKTDWFYLTSFALMLGFVYFSMVTSG